MRRPLALFGFAFFITMLAAVWMPAGFVYPAALILTAALAVLYAVGKAKNWLPKAARQGVCILAAAVILALAVQFAHSRLVAQPVQNLAGSEYDVTALVTEAAPDYGGDTMRVSLEILSMDGAALAHPIRVQVSGFAEVEVGDAVSLRLSFYGYSVRSFRSFSAKGVYVGARAASTPQVTGQSLGFVTGMRRLQYAAGDNIRTRLPLRLSSVLSAMAVGDRRYLSAETIGAYRAAGLSHVLVVSGLHLSILCGAFYAAFRRLLHRKRIASAVCILFVLAFMAFTGFTPSIVRSGVAFLLVYIGNLFYRRADIFTSLAVAAFVLCLQNPYAAADIGLLLSFSATLGAVGGGALATKLRGKADCAPTRVRRRGLKLAALCMVPLCVTLATLPVLMLAGMSISLLSLPANLIAVPLIAPIVLAGLVCSLPVMAVFNWLAAVASLVAGVLLVVLERLTALCAAIPWATVYLSGAVAVAVLLLYPLGWLAYKSRRVKAFLLAGLVVLAMGISLQVLLSRGLVRITVVGNGAYSSVVVTQNRQAAVIYRDRRTLSAVQQELQRQGIAECVLLVDLRATSQSTEYIGGLRPAQIVVVNDDVLNRAVYPALEDAQIYIAKQDGGMVACVDVAGYKVGASTGSFDLQGFAPLDVLLPGRGSVQGEYGALLTLGAPPEWLAPGAACYTSEAQPVIFIRPGQSVHFREVIDGTEFS